MAAVKDGAHDFRQRVKIRKESYNKQRWKMQRLVLFVNITPWNTGCYAEGLWTPSSQFQACRPDNT